MRSSELAATRSIGPFLSLVCFDSVTWTVPSNGILELRAMGAGGASSARTGVVDTVTGGYSGSWGAKRLRVRAGDVVSVSVGAPGATAAVGQTGGAGGNTTITVAGVSYIAYGGPGGRWAQASAGAIVLPPGPSPSANWDLGAASVRPGMLVGGATGGAGVDIMAKGGDASTSAPFNGGGGGGVYGPGDSTYGGGSAPGSKDVTGKLAVGTAGTYLDASDGEWGISFFGGSGGGSNGTNGFAGGNGGGGGGGTGGGGAGGNGGGGGGQGGSTGAGGGGGVGGGGGAGRGAAPGGAGYAFLKFFADKGV